MSGALISWYSQLSEVKQHLITKDPKLAQVFETVDKGGFQLHTVIKQPYPALIGAIIGQKITYTAAKSLRGELYTRYGTEFIPTTLYRQDLSFLGPVVSTIIYDVTEYIMNYNVNLNTEEGIRSLMSVKGIGTWTIETTLITTFKNWNLFPIGDKFLEKRIIRLYGPGCDTKLISNQWAPYRSLVTWYLWRWF
ncbi:Hypothetical protein HVR_LOCUS154 [uncultured virus]|nr:Hypothetical protein HVR_LOCUS154 [uncultured virus]